MSWGDSNLESQSSNIEFKCISLSFFFIIIVIIIIIITIMGGLCITIPRSLSVKFNHLDFVFYLKKKKVLKLVTLDVNRGKCAETRQMCVKKSDIIYRGMH